MAANSTIAPDLKSFPSWLTVLHWIEADREIFYHAPMDRQPIRVQATRGRGSYRYKVKITPPAATLHRTHPEYVDPFWADAGHLVRFYRIEDPRYRTVPPAAGQRLTMREFTREDHTIAQDVARRLGYRQYAYTSTSNLWGYFCLPENPEHHPNAPHQQRIIIATAELGIMVVQDLEDLHMRDLWELQNKIARAAGRKDPK